MEDKIINILTF